MNEVLYGDKDFVFTYEMKENMPFVHLSVKNFNKTSLKRSRAIFNVILDYFADDYEVVFATTEKEKSLKLWKLIKPADELIELKQGKLSAGWLGAWYTGEQ